MQKRNLKIQDQGSSGHNERTLRNELRIQTLASIKRVIQLINIGDHKDLRMRCSSTEFSNNYVVV